jgi:hypothetical protein
MINSDGTGNIYLGNAFKELTDYRDIASPAVGVSNFNSNLSTLCTQANLRFRNVNTVEPFTSSSVNVMLAWGAQSDSIDDRWIFGSGTTNTSSHIAFFNNSGYTSTNNNNSSVNRLFNIANATSQTWSDSTTHSNYAITAASSTRRPVSFIGVCDGESLGIVAMQTEINATTMAHTGSNIIFWYGGTLLEATTADNLNRQIALFKTSTGFTYFGQSATAGFVGGVHYNSGSPQEILRSGRALYSIKNLDNTLSTGQVASDLWVFNSTNSNILGKVRNVLVGHGYFLLGKPVIITGAQRPTNGFNIYYPVGYIQPGRCLLLACYSSGLV